MNPDIQAYHNALTGEDRLICDILYEEINRHLTDAESRVWHGHPVWFLDGNPIVGYSRMKNDLRLMFWSGQSFEEAGLQPEGKFKAAEVRYHAVGDIDRADLQRWLGKSRQIQWDYKNIVKRKGKLERLG
jgi:hypothetical protein